MMDLFDYPAEPGWKARDTAEAAAEAIKPSAATLRNKVLDVLENMQFTADEVADIMGASVLSIRPRFSELSALGLIEDTGVRRKNESQRSAIVWRLKQGTKQ